MATVTAALTLTSTTATSDDLKLSVSSPLTTTNPVVTSAKTSVDNTGANNIIQPRTDGQTYYVYVKHTGVDASGSTVTTTLNVELTGDTVFGKLAANEFMFVPVGGHSLGVQLQASSGTIVAEYAYFTKA
tara:strand:- start:647 stop:1036 length:390 start_codon:yes stop_codon:yes gene_type:complete